MANIIGVRFKTAGKVYYFDPLDFDVRRGSHVIVETVRGIEYGTVLSGPKEVPDEEVVQPLKEVIRVATDDDDARETYNRIREHEAYLICKEKIREHNLEMKLIKAEYTFDNNKLIFYFTADGRVDFRGLVKDLAGVFRTRIELRQIGVRDETKLLGGVGICGRDLCCHTFLSGFAPVSIRMAKEQNLSLNPTKISGVCGRLMCCLKNEAETYAYLNSRLPRSGEWVNTPDGLRGEVYGTNVLRQLVKVVVQVDDEKDIRTYPVDELQFSSRGGKKKKYTNDASNAAHVQTGTAGKAPAGGEEAASGETAKDSCKAAETKGHTSGEQASKANQEKEGKNTSRGNTSRKGGSSYHKKNKNKGSRSNRSSSHEGGSDSGRSSQKSRSSKAGSETSYSKGENGQNGSSNQANTGSSSQKNQNYKRRNRSRKNRSRSSEKKNE